MSVSKAKLKKFVEHWEKKDKYGLNNFILDNVLPGVVEVNVKKPLVNVLLDNHKLFIDELNSYIEGGDVQIADVKPKTKHNYIGIEIECFSECSFSELQMLAIEYGVAQWVDIGDDGSIDPDYGRDYELRVLIRENIMDQQLKKLAKFLKAGEFGVNDSCGLHVHLDMRNRKFTETYEKLIKFQYLMFGMVSKYRQEDRGGFCEFVNTYNRNQRYVAINKTSYEKYKTIEIRLHEGTVDTKLMSNWIKLLLKMVNNKITIPNFKEKESVLKWLGKSKSLKKYVKETYNPKWKNELENFEYNDVDDEDDW